jgi:hypothetical protein
MHPTLSRPSRRDNGLAVGSAIQTLDLPNIRLNSCPLQLLNRSYHERGTQMQVVKALASLEPIRLFERHRDEQFEQETAAGLVAVVREFLEPRCLPAVHRLVVFRIVANQHLDESRRKGLDMISPSIAVFEEELLLPALFGRRASYEALRAGIAKNLGAELLVDQDTRRLPRRPLAQRQLESFIDYLLAGDDRRRLVFRQRRLEAKEAFFKARSLIEGQYEEWAVITKFHCVSPSRLRTLLGDYLRFPQRGVPTSNNHRSFRGARNKLRPRWCDVFDLSWPSHQNRLKQHTSRSNPTGLGF